MNEEQPNNPFAPSPTPPPAPASAETLAAGVRQRGCRRQRRYACGAQGAPLRGPGPAPRGAARHRRDGLSGGDAGADRDVAQGAPGRRPDGPVAHRHRQDRRVRHPDRQRRRDPTGRRAGAGAAAHARAGAAGRARAGQASASTAASWSCRSTAARRWASRSSAAARARRSSSERRGACSTTSAAARSTGRVRCLVLDECDEMLSMGFQEDIEEILERPPDDAADDAVLGDDARGDPAAGAPPHAQPRVPEAVGRLRRRARDPARLLRDRGRQPRARPAARPRTSRNPKTRDHLLQHARGDRARRRVPAQARASTPRPSRRTWRRTTASASWPRPAPARLRFLVATDVAARGIDIRTSPTSSTTRSPSRPRSTSTAPAAPARRQERHGDLAGRPARDRRVLLPEAALQDQARGARAAVGGRDPIAPRGRARPAPARASGRRAG